MCDVRHPVPGTWTGVIFGDVASVGGTNGTIPWQVATQQFAPFGSVLAVVALPGSGPEQDGHGSAPRTPSSPGDAAGSIVLSSSAGTGSTAMWRRDAHSIPVTLRSLVDVARRRRVQRRADRRQRPGARRGTGADYYEFNVGPGVSNITANVSLTQRRGQPGRRVPDQPRTATPSATARTTWHRAGRR